MHMNLLNNLKRLVLSATGIAMLFGGVMCFTGCVDLDVPQDNTDVIEITLRLDETFQEKVNVRLNHNGTAEDYWYYMLTQDFESDAKQLLAAEIRETIASDTVLIGNVGTNKNITFENLKARTTYRAIAAIIAPDGRILGEVADLVFETKRDPAKFEIWPAWQITYKERRVAPEDPDQETDVFSCTVAEGDTLQTYIPCVLSKADFEKYYKAEVRDCFEDYIDYRNSLNVKWVSEVKNKTFEYTQDRFMSGDYMLFMIGVDKTGELTGYYAQKECTIKQETPSDAYKAWIGTWKLKGECLKKTDDGQTRTLEYNIDIVPTEHNLYYELYGYDPHTMDGLSDIPSTIPLKLQFEKSSGDVYVMSEQLPDIKDNQALADFYDFFVYGSVEVIYYDVLTVIPVDMENLPIARFSLTDSSHAKGYGTNISIDLYGEHYNTKFVAFNYFYSSLGLFNYILSSADLVLRTETITLEKK